MWYSYVTAQHFSIIVGSSKFVTVKVNRLFCRVFLCMVWNDVGMLQSHLKLTPCVWSSSACNPCYSFFMFDAIFQNCLIISEWFIFRFEYCKFYTMMFSDFNAIMKSLYIHEKLLPFFTHCELICKSHLTLIMR